MSKDKALAIRKEPIQIYLSNADRELIEEICLDLRLKRSVFIGNVAVKEAKRIKNKMLNGVK